MTVEHDDRGRTPLQSSPCLQGERLTFTGTLASMTHEEARCLAEEAGGTTTDRASRQTTMLVVGEEGWPLDEDGRPAQDFQRVTEWIQQGHTIRLLKEGDWLHLLGLDDRRDEVHRLYTPAMLSELLGVPVSLIRRWWRLELIQPVKEVKRLPYFDFREVTSVRKLARLLQDGVRRDRIEESLRKLRESLEGVEPSLAQLDVLAQDSAVLYRDGSSLVELRTGQRFFDFERPEDDDRPPAGNESDSAPATIALRVTPAESDTTRWGPDDWFREGCRLQSLGQLESAAECFRMGLMDQPGDPELNLHLAETLYLQQNLDGALERFYAAVEADHEFIEAWTQLGCILEERGRLESAADAFRIALEVHSEYPDAHYHLAELLHRLDQTESAIPHWKTYLEYDTRGPWADRARQQLERAGAGEIAPEPDMVFVDVPPGDSGNGAPPDAGP